ncbi:MAG: TerB family tellurite resistance protein [Desulfuromonadaceae bacterium]|nr:TerB family tellurite resistance protein [Desulfuromonadaceae bacterium]MDD2848660.1 TerB family tellurite resistance protein [Desulfuromonadaceae bacterium]MDD4130837.1 TerB family tellurite resistance protein [Desulfuromonadaceae bacterium]
MAKNICIECGTKRKLFSFNYAGFDIRGGDFHSFPERIQASAFPGNKDDDFLCADCANKQEVTCSVHGRLDDYFALGVPPRCFKCKAEVSSNIKDAKVQSFWAKQYPDAENDIRLKMFYTRGGLACSLMKSDGKFEQSELDVVIGLSDTVSGNKEGEEYNAFYAGYNDYNGNVVSNAQILENCTQLKDETSNKTTIMMLLKIASADGFLDRSEFDFIRKVSQGLEITPPEFDVLASKLNLQTSDFQKDELIAKAKTFGLGALAIGGAALCALLEESGKQDSSKDKNPGSSKKSEHRISGNFKRCGSCIHWAGSRTCSSNRYDAVTESANVKGKCTHKKRVNSDKHPDTGCGDWQKWNALK